MFKADLHEARLTGGPNFGCTYSMYARLNYAKLTNAKFTNPTAWCGLY